VEFKCAIWGSRFYNNHFMYSTLGRIVRGLGFQPTYSSLVMICEDPKTINCSTIGKRHMQFSYRPLRSSCMPWRTMDMCSAGKDPFVSCVSWSFGKAMRFVRVAYITISMLCLRLIVKVGLLRSHFCLIKIEHPSYLSTL
jgi:hypothetical protein